MVPAGTRLVTPDIDIDLCCTQHFGDSVTAQFNMDFRNSVNFFIFSFFCIVLSIFILHLRESELYRYIYLAQSWTGRPHLLGCCHFRIVWATCLPHKGGGVPLSALSKDTLSKFAGF